MHKKLIIHLRRRGVRSSHASLWLVVLALGALSGCAQAVAPRPTLTPAPIPTRALATAAVTAAPVPTLTPIALGDADGPTAVTSGAALPTPPPIVSPATSQCPGAAGPETRLSGQRRGVNLQAANPTEYDALLDKAQALGAGWVRVPLSWATSEPQRGSYQWQAVDALANGARSRGLQLLLTIADAPTWANPNGGLPTKPDDITGFAGALAGHLKGKAAAYEVWPAINTAAVNGGTVAAPGAYVDTLAAAYGAIKQADPCALVLSGALVPTTQRDPQQATDDLAYYRDMLAHDNGAFRTVHDIVGLQLNTSGSPGRGEWDGQNPSAARGYVGYAAVFRDEMLYNDEGSKQVWVVDTGYALNGAHAVVPEQQGQDLVSVYEWARKTYPWTTAIFANALERGGAPDGDDSLLDASGAPRPGYAILSDYFAQRNKQEQQLAAIDGTELVELWRFGPNPFPVGQLVRGNDGAIYSMTGNGYVRAIEPNGALRLVVKPGRKHIRGVAVDGEQQLYASTDLKTISAYTRGGAPLWSIETEGAPATLLAISPDGTALYSGSHDRLTAYAAHDGAKQWTVAVDGAPGDPLVGSDGTIFLGASDGQLRAIQPDGTVKWTYAAGAPIHLAPVLANGALTLVNDSGLLASLDANGKERWRLDLGAAPQGLSIGQDQTLYITTADGALHAVGADGTQRWSLPVAATALTAPAVAADGRVFIGGEDGTLRVVDANGVLAGTIGLGAPIAVAPLATSDGMVIVAVGDKRNEVLAFGSRDLKAMYNVP